MSLILCEYVKNTLVKNAIAFGFFLAGVVLGVALIMLVYFIYTKLKAKPPKLKKNYEYIEENEDAVVAEAKRKLYALDVKVPIDSYVVRAAGILLEAIKEIASDYTEGKKFLSIDFLNNEKYSDLDLSFDADFVMEDFLIFVQEVSKVVENTVLTVTDKYSVLVNSFLRLTGLGQSIREITVKDVVLYLNQKADKSQKKLEKAVEKKKADDEKRRLKVLRKENEKLKKIVESRVKDKTKEKNENQKKDVWSIFRPKKKEDLTERERKKLEKLESKERKKIESEKKKEEKRRQKEDKKNQVDSVSSDAKLSAFNKPINKVITEVVEELIVGVCVEARKLYGRGYKRFGSDDASSEGGENV